MLSRQGLAAVLRSYGPIGFLRLACEIVLTKAEFPKARLIRWPNDIRGRRWIRIGSNFTSGRGLRMEVLPQRQQDRQPYIDIDDNVQVNDHVHIAAAQSVKIGKNVLIASKVFISDHNHGSYGANGQHDSPVIHPLDRRLQIAPVVIDEDVWIGEFVSILPGVHIGAGAVIGTMSVVNRNIPAYSIAVGSPARVIKRFNFDSQQWEPVKSQS
jgi:acetyltransferase-like isoleucine patch superfamily enzyme